jgi:hypothetical protein
MDCLQKLLPLLVEKSMKASSMKGNPVQLLPEEITELIQFAFANFQIQNAFLLEYFVSGRA